MAHDAGSVLSVDLGTSNTVAVLHLPGWSPRLVEVDGASAMPSAVFAAADGRLVAGREAVRLARTAPARYEPNPKRRIDEGQLLLGDAVVPVAAALGAVLGKVAAEVSRQLGGTLPGQVRLTHPAKWGAVRCEVLLEAARLAGFHTDVRLIPEPVAAAAHFVSATGRVLAPGQALAVYDLGAGTFDVAVVGAGPQGLSVLAESGLPDVGGLDIDQALLDHLGGQVAGRDEAAWQRLLTPRSAEDRRAALVLREDVRVAKEVLSEHPQTEVALPEPFGSELVTRAELESLIRPGLRRTVELLGTTTRGAGAEVGWLTAVYLVGGSSRIPLVATLMAEELGIVPTALDQPETAVALGAHQVGLAALAPVTQPVEQAAPPRVVPYPPVQPVQPVQPGKGTFRRRIAVLSALSIVVIAAVVAVLVLKPWQATSTALPSSTVEGPNGKGGFHWSLTSEEAGFSEGLWATPEHVVFGHWKGLTAYDVKSGKELWSWQVPEGNYLCNMSQTVAGLIGAFTYGPKGVQGEEQCRNLQTISVRTGELNWAKPVSLAAEGYGGWLGKLGGASLSISDTVVTAAYAGPKSQAEHSTDLIWVDTETGERLGQTDAGTEPVYLGCRLTGHAQAQRDSVVAIAMCTDSAPKLLTWRKNGGGWGLSETLDGCGEISNLTSSAFMHPGRDGQLLIGCFTASTLQRVYHVVSDGLSATSIDLNGKAVSAIGDGESTGRPPENVLLDNRDVYLPRGDRDTSNGVVVTTTGRSWEYTVRDATDVRLMAAHNEAVTLLVVQPGPAALYTVTGPNQVREAPKLPSEVADKLPGAKQTVRVGDHLVCAFSGLEPGSPVIGVVPLAG
ncbi:hypothetical protein A4R43_21395 [Amycolatopsis albispora]|uniref:Heat-shock protein Hsp70 n=1 Tax=Amycolatopsis albispora TaxID=1804986 RepID=A0A344L9L7_9PSEU|nr:hypothetical protein A4R43_21395 [Amycolatopsis albispora]